MKVLVTGSGGFLGRAVVRAVAQAGHEVLALRRPSSLSVVMPIEVTFPGRVTVIEGDLRQFGDWVAPVSEAEAVIHCAAAASGDLSHQLSGTVLATENLLASLGVNLRRFVHVSTFSVYNFAASGWARTLDENTGIEPSPLQRDIYTQTKLQQERLVCDWTERQAIPLVVARPGAIYGPGKDWGYGAAFRVGRFDLLFAPLSRMRLIYVDNCANMLTSALTCPVANQIFVNLVDSEQPTHWGFHRCARQAGADVGIGLPVPYFVLRGLSILASLASAGLFSGRARLPEWLDTYRLRARWGQFRYDNRRANEFCSCARISLTQGLQKMIDEQ
jgi:2-alkyl-3-oxoalkanoate reductase